MNVDNELEMWRREWQANSVPIELVRRVERQSIAMRQYRWAEKVVTVVFGVGSIGWAFAMPGVITTAFAVGIWVFLLFAWAFALKHTKGLWEPSAPTTTAYLDLSIRRCRWKIADARYDSVQGVLITVFVFVIDYFFLTSVGRWEAALVEKTMFWILCALVAVTIAVVYERKRRRAQAELQTFLTILQQLLDTTQ